MKQPFIHSRVYQYIPDLYIKESINLRFMTFNEWLMVSTLLLVVIERSFLYRDNLTFLNDIDNHYH